MRASAPPLTVAEIDAAAIHAWDTAMRCRLGGQESAAQRALTYIDSLLDQRLTYQREGTP